MLLNVFVCVRKCKPLHHYFAFHFNVCIFCFLRFRWNCPDFHLFVRLKICFKNCHRFGIRCFFLFCYCNQLFFLYALTLVTFLIFENLIDPFVFVFFLFFKRNHSFFLKSWHQTAFFIYTCVASILNIRSFNIIFIYIWWFAFVMWGSTFSFYSVWHIFILLFNLL